MMTIREAVAPIADAAGLRHIESATAGQSYIGVYEEAGWDAAEPGDDHPDNLMARLRATPPRWLIGVNARMGDGARIERLAITKADWLPADHSIWLANADLVLRVLARADEPDNARQHVCDDLADILRRARRPYGPMVFVPTGDQWIERVYMADGCRLGYTVRVQLPGQPPARINWMLDVQDDDERQIVEELLAMSETDRSHWMQRTAQRTP